MQENDTERTNPGPDAKAEDADDPVTATEGGAAERVLGACEAGAPPPPEGLPSAQAACSDMVSVMKPSKTSSPTCTAPETSHS